MRQQSRRAADLLIQWRAVELAMEDPAVGDAALDALLREAERLQADYARLVDDAGPGTDELSLPAPPGPGEPAP